MKCKFSAPIAGAIIGLAVILAVGLLIVEQVFTVIGASEYLDTSTDAGYTTFQNVQSYTRSGLQLLAVMIIVLVGSAIVSVWQQ